MFLQCAREPRFRCQRDAPPAAAVAAAAEEVVGNVNKYDVMV